MHALPLCKPVSVCASMQSFDIPGDAQPHGRWAGDRQLSMGRSRSSRRLWLRGVALGALALVACDRREQQIAPSPPPRSSNSAEAVSRSDAEAAMGSGSAPASPPSAAPDLLPPLETACKTSGDCALAWTYEIDRQCCRGTCSPKPTTKSWVAKVEAICASAGHAANCPTAKCVPPPPVLCKSNRCVLGAPSAP